MSIHKFGKIALKVSYFRNRLFQKNEANPTYQEEMDRIDSQRDLLKGKMTPGRGKNGHDPLSKNGKAYHKLKTMLKYSYTDMHLKEKNLQNFNKLDFRER